MNFCVALGAQQLEVLKVISASSSNLDDVMNLKRN